MRFCRRRSCGDSQVVGFDLFVLVLLVGWDTKVANLK